MDLEDDISYTYCWVPYTVTVYSRRLFFVSMTKRASRRQMHHASCASEPSNEMATTTAV